MKRIFENLYLVYFGMITVMAFKDTTMFNFGWTDTQLYLVFLFGILVVFGKSACDQSWKWYEILIAILAASVLALSWHHYMRRYILELAVLIIGARGVDSDRVIKVFFAVSTACALITMTAALTGKIENLVYVQEERGGITRIAFGGIYPTDFSAHIFFTAACYLWLRIRNIRWRDLVLTAGFGMFCMCFCGARTSALGLWLLAVYGLLKKKEILKKNRKIQYVGCFFMPVCAAGSVFLALIYNPDTGWMKFLNRILNKRLSQGHEGFQRYSIPLLGQEVIMHGNGGTIHLEEGVKYFFLDSSYINILLQYGILVLALLTALSVWIMFRLMKAQMQERMFILEIVFLCCVMEQHLMEIAYNPFWLMALAEINIFVANAAGTKLSGKKLSYIKHKKRNRQ